MLCAHQAGSTQLLYVQFGEKFEILVDSGSLLLLELLPVGLQLRLAVPGVPEVGGGGLQALADGLVQLLGLAGAQGVGLRLPLEPRVLDAQVLELGQDLVVAEDLDVGPPVLLRRRERVLQVAVELRLEPALARLVPLPALRGPLPPCCSVWNSKTL